MISYEKDRSATHDYLYNQRDNNLNFPTHLHNSYELLVCLNGNITVNIEDNTYCLNQNDCCLVLPMQLHSYTTNEHSQTAISIFSCTYIKDFYDKHHGQYATNPVFKLENPASLIADLEQLTNEYKLRAVLYNMIAEFSGNTTFIKYDNKKHHIMRQIVEYISDNCCKNITLENMTKELGYSYNYVSNMIYSIFKTNFNEIVNRHRINHAKQLVASTNYTFTEIADMCGYGCPRSFNRNYLKYLNSTPTIDRKQAKL